MTITAGKLRHRVRLQSPVQSRGAGGEVIVTWRTEATVWAAIEPLSAREFVQSQAVQSQITARIVIRYRGDVRATWRAVHLVRGTSGRVYNIHAPLADADSGTEYLTLPVSEGVNDGE